MLANLEDLLRPPTPTAARALDVVTEWSTPALVNHCLRSWAWAVALAETEGIRFDGELLFVATMLHDLGLVPEFDSARRPFEVAGGAMGRVFAAGAGWEPARRIRVAEIIERHMWREVDPALDAEGHLLEAATSVDVAGAGMDAFDPQVLRAVAARHPRLDFASSFAASIHDQADRKHDSTAARLDGSGRIPAGEAAWHGVLDA